MPISQQFSGTKDEVKGLLERQHPLYKERHAQWQLGLDAYDGSGGFLNGGYLWPFARERESEFLARKAQARYHNYAATIIDLYVRSLLEGVKRTSEDPELEEWWKDVDSQGTTIDEAISKATVQALAGGHAEILIDSTDLPVAGPSKADNPNQVLMSTFASVDMLDWRTDRQGLVAVKLKERRIVLDLAEEVDPQGYGYLLWDRDSWARFDHDGLLLDADSHGLGAVPAVVLRPIPSVRHGIIGTPLVNPSIQKSIFNLGSYEDLVLRDQAFSLFVVVLPPDADEEAMNMIEKRLAQGVGTTTAIVTKGASDYKTADMQVPATIRESQTNLVKELFRMAYMRFSRDSREAESAEAIRLQRKDLDQALRNMAQLMQRAEWAMVQRYYGWRLDRPILDIAAELDAREVQIVYPRDFTSSTITEELESLSAALAMKLGQTATAEVKRRAVSLILPDLAEDTLQAIEAELVKMQEEAEVSRELLQAGAADRLMQQGVQVQGPEQPEPGQEEAA